MIGFILCFFMGLIIGWNFLPQPDWVKELVDKIFKNNKGA